MLELMAFELQFNTMTKIDSRPKSWNFIKNRSIRKGISSGAQIYIDSANFNKSQKKICATANVLLGKLPAVYSLKSPVLLLSLSYPQ